MRVRVTLGLLLVALYGVQPAWPQAPAGSQLLVLTNANVIDGVSEKPIRHATVIVRDGKIVSVAATSSKIPHGATVLDLKGRWLLPGLIDAHVHVNEDQARVALESGVTTVRTGSGGISVREQHRAGVTTLPDVVASEYQIVRQPPPRFFLAFPQLADMKDGVHGPDHMRRIVRALIDSGVDVIKILATERAGLQEADPRRRTFTDEELVAAIQAATLGGRAVMAHAHGDEGASAAVRAGVRSIEHGTYLSDATLSLMKVRGTFFVPTITVFERYAAMGGPGPQPNAIVGDRSRAMLPLVRAVTTKALKMGVRIVAGSDNTYNDKKYGLHDELTELRRAGLSPMAAIKAATSVAAECLMIQARTGAIRPGLEADLIVVDRDPTADLEALRDVLFVLNDGKIVINRLPVKFQR
jgi:imidazolonepropionase-like amidohydrolase